MDRDTYTNQETADFINQHFVAVKVDFDASPKLVAQLQRAQALLNLPAGLPLTSFVTPNGKLYFGAGYLPAEHKDGRPSFREIGDEALAATSLASHDGSITGIVINVDDGIGRILGLPIKTEKETYESSSTEWLRGFGQPEAG